MTLDTLKLELIERVMKMKDHASLEKLEELIVQAEMEARSQESIRSIEKGDTVSLKEFSTLNKQWLKEKSMK